MKKVLFLSRVYKIYLSLVEVQIEKYTDDDCLSSGCLPGGYKL